MTYQKKDIFIQKYLAICKKLRIFIGSKPKETVRRGIRNETNHNYTDFYGRSTFQYGKFHIGKQQV